MKVIKMLLLLLSISLISGCMKEDYSYCPQATFLLINFEYFDGKGKDIFNERINKVDVIIFDKDTNFHTRLGVEKQELQAFRGVKQQLDPGIYYIMAWANVTEISGISNRENGKMTFENVSLNHLSDFGTDPLHYAPDKRDTTVEYAHEYAMYEVVVESTGMTTHTLPFMSAYRTVNVYIQGLERVPDITTRITSLSPAYDFHLKASEKTTIDFKKYPQHITLNNGVELLHAKYYVPHFDNENDIQIEVSGIIGYPFTNTQSMQNFLTENKITVFDGDDLEIDILFKYEQGHLATITVPGWSGVDIDPSYD